MHQIVDNCIDNSPIGFINQKFPQERMHHNWGQREQHKTERDQEEHECHAANLLIALLRLGRMKLASGYPHVVADQRITNQLQIKTIIKQKKRYTLSWHNCFTMIAKGTRLYRAKWIRSHRGKMYSRSPRAR